ncbi:hypothetical protein PG994_009931 [Apiospora phragmitis]|uniref:2EXR domain-containing protein n=1 Tax=Apiospora phragmitis TaxID=2905665 RepID=A0ABR1TQQ2_9PEZI
MSTFHPFHRLPLELRLSIWSMATEPRLVIVGASYYGYGVFGAAQTPSPPPPLLGVCHEARSFLLQSYYTKAFENPDSGQYQYVNFAADTVQLVQRALGAYPREAPWIQRLSIDARDSESFYYKRQFHLREDMTGLKQVTIIHQESGDE